MKRQKEKQGRKEGRKGKGRTDKKKLVFFPSHCRFLNMDQARTTVGKREIMD